MESVFVYIALCAKMEIILKLVIVLCVLCSVDNASNALNRMEARIASNASKAIFPKMEPVTLAENTAEFVIASNFALFAMQPFYKSKEFANAHSALNAQRVTINTQQFAHYVLFSMVIAKHALNLTASLCVILAKQDTFKIMMDALNVVNIASIA